MAKFEKGILGSFRGRVGTVVGASWKGTDYIKSRNSKSSKPPTEKQTEQRARFAFVMKFISPIAELYAHTFKDVSAKMTGINSAFRYNYDHALTGTYPAFAMDYSKVLISKGQLHNAINPTASAAGGGIIKFGWGDNSGNAMANADDKSILVVYCRELDQYVYTTTGAARNAGSDSLNVGNFTGKTVETWVGFITADGKDVATSVYTGELVVS
jgi:hypothetical protein